MRNKVRYWETLKYDWFSINGIDRKLVLWSRSFRFYHLELAALGLGFWIRIRGFWSDPQPAFEKSSYPFHFSRVSSGSSFFYPEDDVGYSLKLTEGTAILFLSRSLSGYFPPGATLLKIVQRLKGLYSIDKTPKFSCTWRAVYMWAHQCS